jgi:hypothetical protein
MKLFLVLLTVAGIVGCASTPRGGAVSYQELQRVQQNLSMKDCPRIDYYVNFANDQLSRRGLLGAQPENLNEDDRLYNSTAHVIIWSLRIGCSNPNRYN